MTIKEKIINGFPLTKKMDSKFECYEVAKRRYIVFWNKIINKKNLREIISILSVRPSIRFSTDRSYIIIGQTTETFKSSELIYAGKSPDTSRTGLINTVFTFFLENTESGEIFFNDSALPIFRMGYRRFIKRINEVLNDPVPSK